jgi:hypothetical protein
VGKGNGCDLAFFFDGVHVNAETELVVATGCISTMYYTFDMMDVKMKFEESMRGDGGRDDGGEKVTREGVRTACRHPSRAQGDRGTSCSFYGISTPDPQSAVYS